MTLSKWFEALLLIQQFIKQINIICQILYEALKVQNLNNSKNHIKKRKKENVPIHADYSLRHFKSSKDSTECS